MPYGVGPVVIMVGMVPLLAPVAPAKTTWLVQRFEDRTSGAYGQKASNLLADRLKAKMHVVRAEWNRCEITSDGPASLAPYDRVRARLDLPTVPDWASSTTPEARS